MAQAQRINDLEITLEALSDSIVEVVHKEQVGWFGVNLEEDADEHPFAWSTDSDSRTQDGLMGAVPVADPAQALEDLSAALASMQDALEAEREAEKANDPRHNLGAFLETLPQGAVKKEQGWRNRIGGGLRGVSRSRDILLDRASKGKDILQDRTSKSRDVLRDRASKGRDALQDRTSKSRDVLRDRASKSRDALQDRASKGIEALKEAASPALACEREGHVFDDVRLIGSSNNLPRFCRRCRNLINVNEEEGMAGNPNA